MYVSVKTIDAIIDKLECDEAAHAQPHTLTTPHFCFNGCFCTVYWCSMPSSEIGSWTNASESRVR